MSMIPYKRNDPTALGQGGLYPLTVPEPSLGEVIDASVQEAWFGVGTGYADSVDMAVNSKMISGTPIDEETFNRDFSRFGIGYIDGMTAEAAQELADFHINNNLRAQTLSAATSGDYFAGMAAGFAVGVVEPKNLAYGIGTSLALSPLGGGTAAFARSYRRIQQLRRAGQYTALKAGDYAALAGGGAVEGMVSAAIMEPSNRDTAQTLQMDYTMADSLWNIGLSTVLGAGLTSLPPLARAKYDKWKGRTHEIVAHEIDLATEQLVTGQKVDVTPVEKLAVGEIEKLPVAEKAAAVEQYVKDTETANINAEDLAIPSDKIKYAIQESSAKDVGIGSDRAGRFVYKVTSDNGNRENGFIDIDSIIDGNARIGDVIIRGMDEPTGRITVAAMRDILGQILIKHPEITAFSGERVSGARMGGKHVFEGKGIEVAKSLNYLLEKRNNAIQTVSNKIDAENQAAISKATTESLSPYSSTAIDKAAVDTLNAMPLADKPDYAKQYDSSIEKMRTMVDEGTLSKEEFDAFMDAADNNNETDTLEALKDLETCLAGLV